MAASDQDIFICASGGGMSGYSVWRMDTDMETDSAEVIMEGLRGCCGQMDIECCEDNLFVSENASFRVGIYDRHGRSVGSFGKRDRTSRSGFGSCCNPMNSMSMSDGTVVTAESSIGHLKRFDTDGNLITYIGKASIGAGCKHCALGHDEENDIYYMMYSDKNAICVMGNIESSPLTPEEKALEQKSIDFLAKAAGKWAIESDDKKEKGGGLLAWFGGGRGGSSQHPVSSLDVKPDGSAKILEGMYKAYGDKSEIELLEDTDTDPSTYQFALAIDQVRFIEGTWKFAKEDSAILEFEGFPAATLARSEAAEECESSCGGAACENGNCKDEDCPQSNESNATVVMSVVAGEQVVEGQVIAELELDRTETAVEIVSGKPTQVEYKLLTKKELGKNPEAKLNALGKQGWDFCHSIGKKMMFKRSRQLNITDGEEKE
jgi:hypothetical protein